MGVVEVLAAMALTIGCVGIVMLAAMAANRLYEHQERRAEERRGRSNAIDEWHSIREFKVSEVEMSDARSSDQERQQISQRFTFHPGTTVTGPKHDEVRRLHLVLALWVLDNVPDSRERSLSLTALQESMQWANAAIAIHTEPEPLAPGQRDEA